MTVRTRPFVHQRGKQQFGSWRQIMGCTTRQDILRRDALRGHQGAQVALAPLTAGCPIIAGSWETPYEDSPTVVQYSTQKDIQNNLDIDHIVPTKNAWNSGAATAPWDDVMRRDFANDKNRPQLLTVSNSTNRSKQQKSPDQWLPPNTGFWCTYDGMWVAVKQYWKLGVTDPERNALSCQFAACP